MIKVLRIINRFNIGGPTYNATFLTAFLPEEYETLLVGGLPEPDERDSLHIPEAYGVKPLLVEAMVRNPNFSSDRKAYRELKKIIRDFEPDVVHTHAAKAGALGRKAARACGVPVIVHTYHGHVFHSYFGAFKTWIFKTIERRLARQTDGIIAISPIQKDELVKVHRIAPDRKVEVIPLGFDLQRFYDERIESREVVRKEWNLQPGEVAVAIVGRLAPVKNHAFFLDIVEELARNGIKPVYFIVGDGSERESIQSQVQSLKSEYGVRIEMTSWITDIARFNAGMDVICLTSNNEGTPVSLIEAQAAGIPVISTNVGGVRDIVSIDNTGYVVPKNDLHAFAEKLRLLVTDEKKRAEMSQNGWTYVQGKFHYTTLVKNMDAYYKRLLAKKANDEDI